VERVVWSGSNLTDIELVLQQELAALSGPDPE
jgi:hypothetical protein